MARVSTIITNFRAGELSPKLHGRVDIQKYAEGVDTLENMIVYPSGGITRRPGTTFVGKTRRTFIAGPLWDPSFLAGNVDNLISESSPARLINFEFSDDQAYVLEFGDQYIHFYRDQSLVKTGTFSAIGNIQVAQFTANDTRITISSNELSNYPVGSTVQITGIQGLVDDGDLVKFNNEKFIVNQNPHVQGGNPQNNEFSIITDADLATAASFSSHSVEPTDRVNLVTEVTTTYTAAQLDEINFTQSADVMYIAHKDHPPRKLTRTSATSFTLTDIDFIDGPWLDENITTTTLYASANTGSVTITASADLFTAADVGRYIRFREILEIQHDLWEASTSYAANATVRYNGHVYKQVTGSTQTSGNTPPVHLTGTETYGSIDWEYQHDEFGHVRITAFTNATTVTATTHEDANGNSILPDSVVGSSNTTTKWSLGAFGGDQGYPRAVAFYEERLYFAGTKGQPQTIFGSVSGDFENHTPGLEDDDAVNITIASDRVNVIKHLLPARFLQILTTSAEFTLSGGTGTSPVTPTNVNVLRETTFGTSPIRPVRAGNSTILVQKGGEKVKELTFDLDTDGLLGVDLTVLADHLTKGGIKDMVWQQEPQLILWFVTNSGELLGLTYDRANGTVGWHRHTTGGKFGTASLQAKLDSPVQTTISPGYQPFQQGDTVTITKTDGTKVIFTAVDGSQTVGEFEFEIVDTGTNFLCETLKNLKTKVDAQPGLSANLGPTHANNNSNVRIRTIVFNEPDSTLGYTKVSVNKRIESLFTITNEGPPIIESVTSIPSGTEDQVYILVKRTVDTDNPAEFNKRTERHIEYLNKIEFDTIEDAVFVDSSVTYDGDPTTQITDLFHLEGKKVQVLADGSAHPDRVVSNGKITLNRSASKVHVGYGYDSNIKTLRLEAGSNNGIAQGEIKRIHGITVRFLDTVGAQIGPDENNLDQLPFRDSSMNQDEAVPLFTGDKEISFPSGYENDAHVFIRQDQALPMTITAIMRRSNTFDA
jgi:hypothetical protein